MITHFTHKGNSESGTSCTYHVIISWDILLVLMACACYALSLCFLWLIRHVRSEVRIETCL